VALDAARVDLIWCRHPHDAGMYQIPHAGMYRGRDFETRAPLGCHRDGLIALAGSDEFQTIGLSACDWTISNNLLASLNGLLSTMSRMSLSLRSAWRQGYP